MTTERAEILTKKIQSAAFDISLYPRLERLIPQIQRVTAQSMEMIIDAPAVFSAPDTVMEDRKDAILEYANPAPFYVLSGAEEGDGILVQVSPTLLCALSECLLGGAFELQAETASPAQLDLELSRVLVDRLAGEISACLIEASTPDASAGIRMVAMGEEFEALLKSVNASALLSLQFTLTGEAGESTAQLTYHIPVDFLEKRGLLEPGLQDAKDQNANTRWHAVMSTNIYHTPIDLPVILDRFSTNLSEFSSLAVGQIIPLEENNRYVDLELKTAHGVLTIAQGLLGTHKKKKAVKLVSECGVPVSNIDAEILCD